MTANDSKILKLPHEDRNRKKSKETLVISCHLEANDDRRRPTQSFSEGCAAGVNGSTASVQEAGAGSSSSAALQTILVKPIPFVVAKHLITKHHYLHSLPGGTMLTFGAFVNNRLLGAITFGAGPALAYRLVKDAKIEDCLTLTRLWLSDQLPANSESRVIGITLKALRRNTHVNFVITYADPAQEHVGIIYQATNWLYTGLSDTVPLYDIGDGKLKHSRSLGQIYGTHSIKYLSGQGLPVKLVTQLAKHRYIYFLDASWRCRLKVPVLPYPKKNRVEPPKACGRQQTNFYEELFYPTSKPAN